jgi:hypothetical protein
MQGLSSGVQVAGSMGNFSSSSPSQGVATSSPYDPGYQYSGRTYG